MMTVHSDQNQSYGIKMNPEKSKKKEHEWHMNFVDFLGLVTGADLALKKGVAELQG